MFRFKFIFVLQSPRHYSEGDLSKETKTKVWCSLYSNTTIKLKTFEKKRLGCLLKKRSLNRTFLWPKTQTWPVLERKLILTWTRAIGYSFQTSKTVCMTSTALGDDPTYLLLWLKIISYTVVLLHKNNIITLSPSLCLFFSFLFSWLHYNRVISLRKQDW